MRQTRVKCPTCKREVDWTMPSRPFCSERCRLIDLGAWMSEQRGIPADDADQEAPPPSGPANEDL